MTARAPRRRPADRLAGPLALAERGRAGGAVRRRRPDRAPPAGRPGRRRPGAVASPSRSRPGGHEALFAAASPAGPPPAPRRLVRLEHARALHALLARLADPAAPPLIARLSGEAGGPPLAGARHPLAGLADGWLVRAEPAAGLLLRWDDGERRDAVERAWLAALLALAPYAPPVALVCADDDGAGRLARPAGRPAARPPLRLTTAAAFASPLRRPTPSGWLDADGRPAPMPVPAS